MEEEREIRFLGDLQSLTLREGGVLVVSVDEHLSQEAVRAIRERVQPIVGTDKILVLGKGVKIGIIDPEISL